jgi:hypothetical protein
MSYQSKRRAAEQAVIDAAVKLVISTRLAEARGVSWKPSIEVALGSLVVELAAIGLEAPDETPEGRRATSKEAAAFMAGHATTLARKCFDAVYGAYIGGAIGLTADQVQQRLSASHQATSPRMTELVAKGYIMASGRRRPTRSGRDAIIWTPTTLALEARQMQMWAEEPIDREELERVARHADAVQQAKEAGHPCIT